MFSHLKGVEASDGGTGMFGADAKKTDGIPIAADDSKDALEAEKPSKAVSASSGEEKDISDGRALTDDSGSPASEPEKQSEDALSDTSHISEPAALQASAMPSGEGISRSDSYPQTDDRNVFAAYSPVEIEISDPIVIGSFAEDSESAAALDSIGSPTPQGAVDSNNQAQERIRFLFVPTACSSFDSGKLARSLRSYAEQFDIDLIVVTGDRGRILPIINEFDQNMFATTMIMQYGLVICKQDFTTRSNPGYVEFRNFAVQLYQGEITGDRFDPGASAGGSASYSMKAFEKLRSVRKPSLVFASPLETSYYDTVVMPGEEFGASDPLGNGTFVQDFESRGYVDAYNAIRYSAPTIGTAHPGFTYSDEKGNFRIDFVLFKNMIPSFADTLYLSGASDLENVRRYAVIGEMAL